jgi:S-adenosylmethionine hydrolase
LASLAPAFPEGTVFLAVVDPGVGGSRLAVALWADGFRFVGPDNGLLSVFAARARRVSIRRIAWTPERLSSSFHGRDLFAPVAARIALDRLPDDWLAPLSALSVDLGEGDLSEVIYIDHYGNAFTGVRAHKAARDATLQVEGARLRYARVFSEAPAGEPFWYENSQGLVEIAMDRGSAAERLGLRVGTPIAWIA